MIACSMCGGLTGCRCFLGTFRDPEGPPEPPPSLEDMKKLIASFPPLPDYGSQALLMAGRLMLRVDELEKRVRELEKRSTDK